MRVEILAALTAVAALALVSRCDGVGLHHIAVADDDDDYRPHYYRDYSAGMRRSARADEGFDDYGHLRFGRSDE